MPPIPMPLLQRGYAIVTRSADGRVLTDATDAPAGTQLTIRLKSGEVKARTEE